MSRAQFLLGLVVFCSGTTWILADSINDGNATVENTTSSEPSDKTRREELEQYYEERSENNTEAVKVEDENSPPNPAISLRKLSQPLYPVEEFTDFQDEVPCDNAQFLLRILTVMLPLLRNEVPESTRTSYILLILKDLLKSSPEAAKDYDIHNKINDLILALEKYHKDDDYDRLDGNPSSALRTRTNAGLPDGIQSKVVFRYEVPNLPNPSCTAEILHIVNVVQKAILKLVNNPLCKSIVPLEVPFIVNFENNYIKPNLYLPSKAKYKIPLYSFDYDTQEKDKTPRYWGEDNTNDVEEIMIPNKPNKDQRYPSNRPDLIDDDVNYHYDRLIPHDIYPFLQTHPTNPTDHNPYYINPKKPIEYPFKPNPYDDRDWRYHPVNPQPTNDEIEYPGSSSKYFDLFQLSTPSTLGIEFDKSPSNDYNNWIPKRPHKSQSDANYPEIIFPIKTDDERNPALLPYDLKKYNTDKPGLPLIDTTGEPQTAYITFGPQTPDEDEVYYIRPDQQPINPNRYDKLPATRPSIIGKLEPINTPRYPSNPYELNWPNHSQDNTYEITDVYGPTTENPIEFDIFGQPIRPKHPTKIENPIKFDIFGRPIGSKYQTTTENTIEFDIFGRPKKPKYSTTDKPIEFDIFGLPNRPIYPNKRPSQRPRPKGPIHPRPNSPDNWPADDNILNDNDYSLIPEFYPDKVFKPFDKHPKMPYIINPIENFNDYNVDGAVFDYAEPNKPNSFDQNPDSDNSLPYTDGKILQIIKDNIDVVIHKLPVHKLSPELIEKIIKLKELLDLEEITVEEYVNIINQYQIIIERVKHMDISNALMKDLLLSITNLDKLDLVTGKSKLIEFTYLVKRPQPLIYQPYYYIKYRLPYNSFLQRTEKLLAENPQLTNYPANLYKAMIPISQVHETSPDLNAYGDDDILRLTFNNGTLVGAKVVKGKDIDMHNAIEQLKQINSDLSVDDTYQLIKNLEAKLKYTPEGLFVKNSNTPALNFPENPQEIRIRVNNKPILKKVTKITTNKIGANKILLDILNKYKYLRSNGSNEDSGTVTLTTKTNSSLEDALPPANDKPKVARSRDDYSSYINEQTYMNKPVIPVDKYLESVNFANIGPRMHDSHESYTSDPITPHEFKFDPYPFTSDITKTQSLQDVKYINLPSKEPSSYIYNPIVSNEDVTKFIDTEFDDTQNVLRRPIFDSKTIVDHFNNKPNKNSLKQLYDSDAHFLDSPLGLVSKSEYLSNPEPIDSHISLTKTYISKPNEESFYGANSNIAGIDFDDTQKLLRNPIFESKTIVNHFDNNYSQKNTLNQMYDSSKTEYKSNLEPPNSHLISHSRTYINGIPVEHTKTYHTINGYSDDTQVFRRPTIDTNIMDAIYKNNVKVNLNHDKYFKDSSLAHDRKSEFVSSPDKLRLVKHSQSYMNGYPVENSKTYVINKDSGHLDDFIKSNLDAEHFKTGGEIANVIDKNSLLEYFKPIANYKSLETLIDKNSLLDNYKPIDNHMNGIDNSIDKDALLQNYKPMDNYKDIGANLGSESVLYNTNANYLAQNPGQIKNQYVAGNYKQDQKNIESNLQQIQADNGQAYTSGGSYISGNNYKSALYNTNANSLAQNPGYINNQYVAGNYNQDQKNIESNLQQNQADNGQAYTSGGSYISGNNYKSALYNTNANSLAQNPGYINNQYVAGNYNQDQKNIESNLQQNQADNGQAYTPGGSYIGNNYNNLAGLSTGYTNVYSIGNNLGTQNRYILQKPLFVPSVSKERHQLFG